MQPSPPLTGVGSSAPHGNHDGIEIPAYADQLMLHSLHMLALDASFRLEALQLCMRSCGSQSAMLQSDWAATSLGMAPNCGALCAV